MTERDEFALYERIFVGLVPDEREALMTRAVARVQALGKTPEHFGYGTLVRLQRDRLLLRERPSAFPAELRRQITPGRERHEPLSAEIEDDA